MCIRDSGLGLFSEEPELTQIAVSTTVDAIITGLLDTDGPREQRLGDLNVWK